jgi:hypothetical protein
MVEKQPLDPERVRKIKGARQSPQVRKQRADLAAVIDVWWQTVRQDVHNQITLTLRWTTWVEAHWLPLMYWQD